MVINGIFHRTRPQRRGANADRQGLIPRAPTAATSGDAAQRPDLVVPWISQAAREHGAFDIDVLDLCDWQLPILDRPLPPAIIRRTASGGAH
jgi:hypothetical protein